jgi:hypothetical protein
LTFSSQLGSLNGEFLFLVLGAGTPLVQFANLPKSNKKFNLKEIQFSTHEAGSASVVEPLIMLTLRTFLKLRTNYGTRKI